MFDKEETFVETIKPWCVLTLVVIGASMLVVMAAKVHGFL